MNKHSPWQQNNKSFLVRIWRDCPDGPWRATVIHIHSREKRSFADPQSLFLYLHQLLTAGDGDQAHPCQG